MNKLKSIAVFCGSSTGNNSIYTEKAKVLGIYLGHNKYNLVYGGGNIGLMGAIATAAVSAGSHVTGVLPHFLRKREVGHLANGELILVESMHERKQKMEQLSDGFIAMPGGLGTLDELAEILTWAQLGLHQKPIGVYNVNGYFDTLLTLFDQMVAEGYMKPEYRQMVLEDTTPEGLLTRMSNYSPPPVPKWLKPDQL